jgi:hypothetical protein
MKILSHRGYWQCPEEKNRELVLSHDMATGGEVTFEELLQLMNGRNLPLALNIKADGLAAEMLKLLNQYDHTNYFTFDMSIPEMVKQTNMQIKVYAPLSDVNQTSFFLEKSSGVWLDGFYSIWYDNLVIEKLISQNLEVCIVSEELHGRPYEGQWNDIRSNKYLGSSKLLICTDKPEEAVEYFNK